MFAAVKRWVLALLALCSTYLTPAVFGSRLKAALWRRWYDFMARRYSQDYWTCMNYGVAAPRLSTERLGGEAREWERFALQMYARVAQQRDLRGAQVLEVGSGRGGGAAWLARASGAARVVGVDFSREQVAWCRRRHGDVPNLAFAEGDACALRALGDGSFDAVVSVESSHCYADVPAFLAEVRRVLRPGGALLLADFRDAGAELAQLRAQVEAAGFRLEAFDDITADVVAALDLDHERKERDCLALVPSYLAGFVRMFIGTKNSRTYNCFARREWEYVAMCGVVS